MSYPPCGVLHTRWQVVLEACVRLVHGAVGEGGGVQLVGEGPHAADGGLVLEVEAQGP